jgi:tryptophanyl-tRNA synthetase
MSLQNGSKKMSKSDPSALACINLIDDPEMIRTKIRKAKTDSLGQITYDGDARPEVSNLLRIYAALEGIEPHKTPLLFENDNMFTFKEKLSNKVIDKICPIGERAMKLCEDEEDYLLDMVD